MVLVTGAGHAILGQMTLPGSIPRIYCDRLSRPMTGTLGRELRRPIADDSRQYRPLSLLAGRRELILMVKASIRVCVHKGAS